MTIDPNLVKYMPGSCFDCGSSKTVLYRSNYIDNAAKPYYVRCLVCGASNGYRATGLDALCHWNSLEPSYTAVYDANDERDTAS